MNFFGTTVDFENAFQAYTGIQPTWFSAALVVAPLITMIAINETQSLDPNVLNSYIASFDRTLYFGPVNFNNTIHDGGSIPLCLQYIPNTGTQFLSFIVAPEDKKVRDSIFGVTPAIPPYLLPKKEDDTDFLLSVILGTILPIIFLVFLAVLVFFLVRKMFDVIVLPKQEKNDWGM